MNKIILVILVSVIMITGCGKDGLNDAYKKISDYFESEDADKSNLGSFYLDEANNVIVVYLIENNTDTQTDFVKQVKVDSKYIEFKQGLQYTSEIDFYISKPISYNDIKFNEYYKTSDRVIYLSGNIDEFYIVHRGEVRTLKNYISQANQTFDNSIKDITNKLIKENTLDDGGTTIYKSEEKDITMIVCSTIDGNKDVYVGDYKMEYEEEMCK